MFRSKFKYANSIMLIGLVLIAFSAVRAQMTEFTYQGRLSDGAMAANGNYDFAFRLYAVDTGGTQIGATVIRTAVPVSNGVFTVRLDFGSEFSGANRWLEILVKQSLSPTFTLLNPRQPITSAPYGIRSLLAANADSATTATTATNALNLGGIAANQYVLTGDSRLSDARNPLAGSSNYIQNLVFPLMQTANFSISGDGRIGGNLITTGEVFSSEYSINGSGSVLSVAGAFNLFVGIRAGTANTTGSQNTFVGEDSGRTNSIGNNNSFFGFLAGDVSTSSDNSFFGSRAGNLNQTGNLNSFFGSSAGQANLVGSGNSFFGYYTGKSNTASSNSFFGSSAGINNTTGANNSFFGIFAGGGASNVTGSFNSFFGSSAGLGNTGGDFNTFIGTNSGIANLGGDRNTIIGSIANVGSGNLTNATAIGANAFVTQSNSLVLGSINGTNSATASTNVGIGTTAPTATFTVFSLLNTAADNTATFSATNIGPNQSHIHYGTNGNWFIRSAANAGRVILQDTGGNVGIGTGSPNSKLQVSGGNIYITNPNSLIITSPNGACWIITVSNSGALSTISTACP